MTTAAGARTRRSRIAGLHGFTTPDLELIERRRTRLWLLLIGLLAVTASALFLLALWTHAKAGSVLTLRVVQGGAVAVLVFCLLALLLERRRRHLSALLVEERVLTTALTNRLGELEAHLAAGRAVNLGLELDEVLDTILASAVDLLAGRDGSIMLVHGDSQLKTAVVAGSSEATGATVRFGEGIAGRVAASREPLLIRGTIDWEHYRDSDEGGSPPSSAISLPMVHREQLFGVLNVNASPERTFTEHDLRALSLFGEHAASAIANAHLHEAQRLISAQNAYLRHHDQLTRMPNRSLFLRRLGEALERPRAGDGWATVLFLDLDRFRRINEGVGPGAGDEILMVFAERLKRCVGSDHTVARFGGDEFAVLLEDVGSASEAEQVAERILQILQQPFRLGDREVRFTASIGIALGAAGVVSVEKLIGHAFSALRSAKRDGGGCCRLFEATMEAEARRLMEMEAALHRAMKQGELAVFFQPIYSLSRRQVVAAEALVRWRHPEQGLMTAASFVPTAQRSGLLTSIDNWVLHEACVMARDLPPCRADETPLSVSVNLPPSRVREPEIVDLVAGVLDETGLEPARLTLEITESGLLSHEKEPTERLSALRDLGVRLSLDDFGTGYSSLSYLRNFPVDQVKIDRMFVEGLTRDQGSEQLVQAILRLGLGLSFEVVAEGIEHQSQLDSLQQLGCSLGQGFLLSHPLPGHEFCALVGSSETVQ